MPCYTRDDGKPIIQFDGEHELSPFALLRRLQGRHPPILVDGRKKPVSARSLAGALPYPPADWKPSDRALEVVVFDEDGSEAPKLVQALRERGVERVRWLFGGLDLYEFTLDPDLIGEDTFFTRE